jgi:uncharacterized repeat protein (TIGR01451 family)
MPAAIDNAERIEEEERAMNLPKNRCVASILAICGLFTMVTVLVAAHPGRAAGSWYVAPAGSDGHDCLSPTTPCATINGALAKPGFVISDTILVATGTYTGAGDEVVLLDKSVTLSGGWDAAFTTQTGTSTLDGEESRRGMTVNSGTSAILERFTVKEGSANSGGGIHNEGILDLHNSSVSDNAAGGPGGGIYNAGTLGLDHSTVRHNSADTGGGIHNSAGHTATLINSIVSGNTASRSGGGIYNFSYWSYHGVVELVSSTVSSNTASDGGGIWNRSVLTLTNSTISGNTATQYGGGIHIDGGALALNSSTVSGNTTTQQGGGIFNGGAGGTLGGSLGVNNSTVSGNTAGWSGGGIRNRGTMTLNSSTVSRNAADSTGGGIATDGELVTLQNTILAGNAGDTGPDCSGDISSSAYSLIGNTSGCTYTPGTGGLYDVEPNLGLLIGPQSAPWYQPLLSGSPAIDAGDLAGCFDDAGNPLDSDQRGAARVGRCDIGAYEYATPGPADSVSAVGGTPQRTAPLFAFQTPLALAVLDSIGSPVSGVTATFSAPATGASGTFADSGTLTTTATTDEGGVATAATFTANGMEGSYAVMATITGVVTPARFLLYNLGWYVAPGGDDANDCQTPTTPCATVGGPLQKPDFSTGDTVLVAAGTYTGTDGEVLLLDQGVRLYGGWDPAFAVQGGVSILDGEGARRGVWVNSGVTAIVERFTMQSGSADSNGGGGIFNQGTLTLSRCNVTGNTGSGIRSGRFGPASLTLYNCTVSGNTATSGGGIDNGGDLTVNNSAIVGNDVPGLGLGGGIRNSGVAILNNSTVSGNTIHHVGGIYNRGTLMLNNSTVSGNTAHTGGGIYNDDYYGGTVTLQNTILAGNTASGDSPDCGGTIGSSGHSLVGDTTACTFIPTTGDLTNVDANLLPLTGQPAYHPLSPTSPAIHAGNPAGCSDHLGHSLDTDQRGFPRFLRCDIGAYEMQPIAFSTKTVDPSSALPAEPLTYTIALTNGGAVDITNVRVTDSLPTLVTYVDNSLTATAGSYGYDTGVVTWTGTVNAGEGVTITFGAMVSEAIPRGISIPNASTIRGGGEVITRTATVIIPPSLVYLPMCTRSYCYCPDFFDDFSNPASGWEVMDDAFVRSEYLNGEYRILTKRAGYYYLFRAPSCDRQNYTVGANARWVGSPGSSYGLIFGLAAGFSRYYLFNINTDYRKFDLVRRDAGGFTQLVSPTYSEAIHGGTATNHLKVTRNGNQITLEVNGTVLGTWSDGTIGGRTGAGLVTNPYSGNPISDARFDNFSMTTLPGSGASALQPGGMMAVESELAAPNARRVPAPIDKEW